MSQNRPRILFLCTGNSCRSQMAEGWGRHLRGDEAEFLSAGTSPHGLNDWAVRVMQEAGIDISSHRSEHLEAFDSKSLDLVVTVCGKADQACPLPTETRRLHFGFDDPPALAKTLDREEEILDCYRRVRDEIRSFVEKLDLPLATA